MSDLSLPPITGLTLMPKDGGDAFAWPTPPLAGYPGPRPSAAPDACEIEGMNGQTMAGRIVEFKPHEGVLTLRPANSRAAVPVRFTQFRRMRLALPLSVLSAAEAGDPAESTAGGAQAELMSQRPAVPFKGHFTDAAACSCSNPWTAVAPRAACSCRATPTPRSRSG